MTTFAQLRKTALSLPESEEGGRSGMVVFTVDGKRFAWRERDNAHLHLPEAEADEFLAVYGTAERLTHGRKTIGVRFGPEDIDGQQLNHWVRCAYLSRAPKRLVERAAAADSATAGGVGDLPKGHRATYDAGAHGRWHHHTRPGGRTDRGRAASDARGRTEGRGHPP